MLDVKSIYDKNADAIKIEISDTGEGIEKVMMEDVFKPFFTTKTKGSGLGLAITRRVVEQHGGVISVKSDPGKRTTFNVYLPLITSSDKEIDVISTTE
jgi:signal transduction histidine kinase